MDMLIAAYVDLFDSKYDKADMIRHLRGSQPDLYVPKVQMELMQFALRREFTDLDYVDAVRQALIEVVPSFRDICAAAGRSVRSVAIEYGYPARSAEDWASGARPCKEYIRRTLGIALGVIPHPKAYYLNELV